VNDETAITLYQGDEFQAIEAYTPPAHYVLSLDAAIAAWVKNKSERTGSAKTKRAYQDTIDDFRALLQAARPIPLDLDSTDTRAIRLAAESFAAGNGVSSATFNQRLAILSSFYTYAIKQEVLDKNPMKLIDRRPVDAKDAAQPMGESEIAEAFSKIDRGTLEGLRDYALLSLAVTTGRRSRELAALCWGDVHLSGRGKNGKMLITWQHCKGNKQMRDEIEPRTHKALLAYLHALHGADLGKLAKDAPIFVSLSRNNHRGAMSIQAVSDICFKRLGTSKVHTTRHTFAVQMEKAGASLSDIGAKLGHASLKTTSDYMKRLHSAENPHAAKPGEMFGI
jgi:site-specific recombinase XerD